MFTPAPGDYLYCDRIKFDLKSATYLQSADTRLPPAEIKSDPYSGRMAICHPPFQDAIDLKEQGAASPVIQVASYQGCSAREICYMLVTKTLTVTLPVARLAVAAKPVPPGAAQGTTGGRWGVRRRHRRCSRERLSPARRCRRKTCCAPGGRT